MLMQTVIKPVLDGLNKLQGKAAVVAGTAITAWQQVADSLSGQPQWGNAGVNILNPRVLAVQQATALQDHLVAFYGIVATWAVDYDTFIAENLPPNPYPTPTQDVNDFAVANGISLAVPTDAPPPPPILNAQYIFMVPGGYLAIIGPSQGGSGGFPAVYAALRGDTVPAGMRVTAPDGTQWDRHSVEFANFGTEDWYTQFPPKPMVEAKKPMVEAKK